MQDNDRAPKLSISGTTSVFGCIAHPVAHVRAPTIFNDIFANRQLDAVMVPVDAPADRLEAVIAGLSYMPNFHGLAVTIPHKMPLAALCDELGAVAQITSAVNAVRFENGRLYGDNFDGAGFVAGLYGEGHTLSDKKILLIGAGGAARAIAYGLTQEPIARLDIHNRSYQKAENLVAAVKAHDAHAPLHVQENPDWAQYDIVINATALGLKEGDAMPCDVAALPETTLVCDIIMVPAETTWLRAAKDRGLACHYGRHMFDYQVALIGQFLGINDL